MVRQNLKSKLMEIITRQLNDREMLNAVDYIKNFFRSTKKKEVILLFGWECEAENQYKEIIYQAEKLNNTHEPYLSLVCLLTGRYGIPCNFKKKCYTKVVINLKLISRLQTTTGCLLYFIFNSEFDLTKIKLNVILKSKED